MNSKKFSAVNFARNAVANWLANDGGLTRYAICTIGDACAVDAAFRRGDIDRLCDLLGDNNPVIADAAQAALRDLDL